MWGHHKKEASYKPRFSPGTNLSNSNPGLPASRTGKDFHCLSTLIYLPWLLFLLWNRGVPPGNNASVLSFSLSPSPNSTLVPFPPFLYLWVANSRLQFWPLCWAFGTKFCNLSLTPPFWCPTGIENSGLKLNSSHYPWELFNIFYSAKSCIEQERT